MLVIPPRCHIDSLGAGYAGVGDGQAFMRLGARQHSFHEVSSSKSTLPDNPSSGW